MDSYLSLKQLVDVYCDDLSRVKMRPQFVDPNLCDPNLRDLVMRQL